MLHITTQRKHQDKALHAAWQRKAAKGLTKLSFAEWKKARDKKIDSVVATWFNH